MKRILTAAALAVVLVASAGCEEGVDAVLESTQPFTLYGFFNPRSDTQAVRVFPIEPILEPKGRRLHWRRNVEAFFG